MPLDDPLMWFRRIFRRNHVFTFLCVWTEINEYIRRTLYSPFLVLEECDRPLYTETLNTRFKQVRDTVTYAIIIHF